MDFNNHTKQGPQRSSRPAQSSQSMSSSAKSTQNYQDGSDSKLNVNYKNTSKSKRSIIIVVLIVAIILITAGALLVKQSLYSSESNIQTDKYQAVFLSNGQVYFGKMSNSNDSYIEINDIYYLQVQQQVQPEEASGSQPKVSLTKLGNELHGPQDQMYISRDQILFWENLKQDSKVSQAIEDHKAKQ